MKKWLISLGAVAVLGLGWYLVSPLFIDQVVDEPVITGAKSNQSEKEANSSQDMMKSDEEDSMSQDAGTNDTMKENETFSGTFQDGDSLHQASGNAMIQENVVRLEDFEVTNGPDLYVYLVDEDQETKDGVSLGKLKGNIGNQNYELPEGTEINEGMKIVIWCKQFNVDFGFSMVNKGV
ncbi:DM13 domain-containing protein [Jeotgalibacillus marinus]|uniref:DM13 domain-containing protein n=1 Tax=Jeotgalibacillus marinus TaxID=86667 RepID=A0ABV3Q707_9BACL